MNYSKLANLSIIFIGFVLLFFILKEFSSFLRPFFIALILSFLFVPITRASRKKKILVVINTFIIIFILFLFGTLFGTLFLQDTTQVNVQEINKTNSFFSNLNVKISFSGKEYSLYDYIDPKTITSKLSKEAGVLFSSTTNFFKELFLILLFLMFILPSFDIMKKRIESRLTKSEKSKFRTSLDEIEKSIRVYLSVKSLISLGTALVSGIVMYFFDVKYMFLFMVIFFILNFIPSIGSFIAVVLVIFSYFLYNGFGVNLFILSLLLILVQIIFGNILEPKITGNKLELSPVIILLSLFFWGYIWGFGGMLFAVPLTSIIKIILSNIEGTKNMVVFLS